MIFFSCIFSLPLSSHNKHFGPFWVKESVQANYFYVVLLLYCLCYDVWTCACLLGCLHVCEGPLPHIVPESLSVSLFRGLKRGFLLNLSIFSLYRAAADWCLSGCKESGTLSSAVTCVLSLPQSECLVIQLHHNGNSIKRWTQMRSNHSPVPPLLACLSIN